MPSHARRADRLADPQASGDDDDNVDDDDDAKGGSHYWHNMDHVMATKLIRYAMACEFSRTFIRRDGVKEKVLGPRNGKAFRRILAIAQDKLRRLCGMELRELAVRAKTTLREKRQAARSRSRNQPKSGSGLYVLATTLPRPFRADNIICPSRAPSAETEATYVAFYTLVVSVIMLSGGELGDHKLQRYLDRLNASPLIGHEKTELVLKRMERQQYVVRSVDNSLDSTITWSVGPRGIDEIGVDGVAGLVREVWEKGAGDLEKAIQTSLGMKPAASEV